MKKDIHKIKKGIQAMEENDLTKWNKITEFFGDYYPLTAVGGEDKWKPREYEIYGIDEKMPKEISYNPLLKQIIWGNETLKMHLFNHLVNPYDKGKEILKSYPKTTKKTLNILKKASKIETEILKEINPFIALHDDLCHAEYIRGRKDSDDWTEKNLDVIDEIFGRYNQETISSVSPYRFSMLSHTRNKIFFKVLRPKFAESEFRKKNDVLPLLKEYLEVFEFLKKSYEESNH